MKYVLASESPRRRRLLSKMGFSYKCVTPSVAELEHPDGPADSACLNAIAKCKWAVPQFPDSTIIAADTLLNLDNETVGKPADLQEARAILYKLSGREHKVITAVAVCFPGGQPKVKPVTTSVFFRELNNDIISDYFSLVDPLDKAGAYDIDQYGAMVVESYSGSYTNIVGLPIDETAEMLGIHLPTAGTAL